MEANEIDHIKNSLNAIEQKDLSFLISEKNGTNIIQRLTAKEIIDIIESAKTILREAIDENVLYSLSRYFVQRENQNQIDFLGTLSNLIKVIENKNMTAIEAWTLQVQNYLYQSGLINLLFRREKPEALSEVKRLRTENKSVYTLLKKRVKEVEDLKSELEKTKQTITKFKNEKEAELNAIKQNLDSTNEIKKQIDATKGQISESKSDVDKILASSNEAFKKFDEDLEVLSTEYSTIAKNVKEKREQTETIISKNKELHIKVRDLETSATELKKQIEKLLDPAIAQNLRLTFKKRKDWLFISKIVWGVITLGFAGIVAYFAFKFFDNPEFDFELEKVVVGALKLTPFVILLYFSIRQYTKDRTLEEEYAFRESIATSLMSFAEQIKGEPNKKDELIKETVNNLYQSPTRLDRSQNRDKNRSGIKELIELIKEVKGVTKIE